METIFGMTRSIKPATKPNMNREALSGVSALMEAGAWTDRDMAKAMQPKSVPAANLVRTSRR